MSILNKVVKKRSAAVDDTLGIDDGAPESNKKQQYLQKIEDVLEVLQIPTTFEIPEEIFMPEDLTNVHFNIEIPQGYDQGQVMRFVAQSSRSVGYFVSLLRARNEDVAKLASVIDKLQVDANNLRFEAEMASGISIMPNDQDLNDNLTEAKLENKRLLDEIERLRSSGAGSGSTEGFVDQRIYEKVIDDLSVERRRTSNLEAEIFNLRTQVNQYEDNSALVQPSSQEYDDSSTSGAVLPQSAHGLPEPAKLGLPDMSDKRKISIPVFATPLDEEESPFSLQGSDEEDEYTNNIFKEMQ